MIKIAIVEDEPSMQKQIKEYIGRFSAEYGIPIETTSFLDGDSIVHNYQPRYDIILMDIQMKFLDGMSAAEIIRQQDFEVIIIFISNMENYAIKGYEVNALYFMVKPVQYFSFSQKLGQAIQKLESRDNQSLILQLEGGARKIKISSICYIESQGHKLLYHLPSEVITKNNATLREAEELFAPFHFFRCNKSYLVNLAMVSEVSGNVAMVGGDEISISRGKSKEFLKAFYEYVRNEA